MQKTLFTIFSLLTLSLSYLLMSGCTNKQTPSLSSPIQDTQGQTHHWKDFEKHWLIINFWASWCAPCREEVPELNALQHQNKQVRIVGISFDELKLDVLKKEVLALGFKFPVLVKDTSGVLNIDKPTALPTTVLFSPGLKHYKTLRGPQTADKLQQIILSGTPSL